MSETETWAGRLVPVELGDQGLDDWIQSELGTTELGSDCDSWREALLDGRGDEFLIDQHDNLYRIEAEQLDPHDLADGTLHSDGSLEFIASFYNGGTWLSEVLEELLDEKRGGDGDDT